MISINVPRVRGKMAEKEYTLTSLSNKLGISRTTLKNYLNNPEKMPYGIVDDLAEILCDSADEANHIFFTVNLRETQTSAQKYD